VTFLKISAETFEVVYSYSFLLHDGTQMWATCLFLLCRGFLSFTVKGCHVCVQECCKPWSTFSHWQRESLWGGMYLQSCMMSQSWINCIMQLGI